MSAVSLPVLGQPGSDPHRSKKLIPTTRHDDFPVALVYMPFGAGVAGPSIQVGLLAAIAQKAGFPAEALQLDLELAHRLGARVYNFMSDHHGRMTGEWLFSIAAFGDEAPDHEDEFLRQFPEVLGWLAHVGYDAERLHELRHEILPRFLDDCAERLVDWKKYKVVGFSSTFYQQCASIGLARRIKERFPEIKIVIGGANMEADMGPEHLRTFPWVDFGVCGEGDIALPELLHCLATNTPVDDVRGLVHRRVGNDGVETIVYNGDSPPLRDLDSLPIPNYDDYFTRARAVGVLKETETPENLLFETSRGCWWGAKHHCTFCGLNREGMAFRAKTPERVMSELSELSERYRMHRFWATDNILDMKHIQTVFGKLRDERADYNIFYEVKANLTREQLRTMYLGGVRRVQPGIESLSSHVLELMRKGCPMLQNVRLLKWCRYYGIEVTWGLLWGFPGETVEDFEKELEVINSIGHLQPPRYWTRIWIERFAPYYFEAESFGMKRELLKPEPSYNYVYPARANLLQMAYFFQHEMPNVAPEESHAPTIARLVEWKERYDENRLGTLVYRRTPRMVTIYDARGGERSEPRASNEKDARGDGPPTTHTLKGVWAAAYEHCSETYRTPAQIMKHLDETGEGFGMSMDEAELRRGLDYFCSATKRLMVSEKDQYFSLALPVNPNW